MSRIQIPHIVAAHAAVEPLTMTKAETLADALFKSQPNLLASVLVLPRFGVSNKDLDVVLKILFICHGAVVESKIQIPMISEARQERCFARLAGRSRFIEGLSPSLVQRAVDDQIRTHREPNLLALAFGLLKEHDLHRVRTEAEKYLLLVVLNIVETLADVLTDT